VTESGHPQTVEGRPERDALEGMVYQFAYFSEGRYHTGGLSALEDAFYALGWDDPQPAPEWAICDEPGCKGQRTCGILTPTGYRSVCGEHYHALRKAVDR